jgi:protein-arginine kinase
MEKHLTRQHKKIVSTIDFSQNISLSTLSQMLSNPQSRPLVSAIQHNTNAIKTYLAGWHTLQSDQNLVSYMRRMGLLSTEQQSIQNYHAVCSKPHKLS